jgi:hypothetical protein
MLDTLHERNGEVWLAGAQQTNRASSGWVHLIGQKGCRNRCQNFQRYGADYGYSFAGIQGRA